MGAALCLAIGTEALETWDGSRNHHYSFEMLSIEIQHYCNNLLMALMGFICYGNSILFVMVALKTLIELLWPH